MDSRYSSSDDDTPVRDGSRSKDASRSGSVSKSKSHRYSPERLSPYSKNKEERRKEDRKYYDRHKSHRNERSKRSRSRSGSPRRKRSRSRSPRRYRDYSPKRNSDDKSPRRKSYEKSNKLSILEKMGIDVKVPESDKGSSSSGLPSYYNPLVINQARYAEQIAKRKLLWNNKKEPKQEGEKVKNASIWQGAKFSQDQDGKMTAKFQRLMGIKEPKQTEQDGKVKDLFKKQEELFSSMEMQYEVARATTHTQRGVGLGFGPRHIP